MPPNPAKSPLKPGALLAGKYRLLKMLGRGAAGVVWAATNVATSRNVALKLLLRPEPRQRERLLREARAAGALHHPNVIDIYDVTELADGNPVLVLELLEGQTLQELIDERAPLPAREAAGIGRDVARALAVAHASGIVHRDLKPSNIFMHQPGDEPPIVKVVDFGISKNLLAGEGTLTETGMAVGSPAFMSPEQVRGERLLDGRTDLWALGVILWEMLAGRRLFDGRTHEVLTQVLTDPIKRLEKLTPGIDPALAGVVHGLLERDAGKRLSSAETVAERLDALADFPKERTPRRSTAAPPPAAAPHDTTVVPRPMTDAKKSIPKAYVDDEEQEPTHVAPFAMRAALAKQTVPSVYSDDEEEEDGDRTKVAPDAVLTEAIRASRSNEIPESTIPTVRPPPEPGPDQNVIPTVRPPPDTASADAPTPVATEAPKVSAAGAPTPPPSSDVDFSGLLGSKPPAGGTAAAASPSALHVSAPPSDLFPMAGLAPLTSEPAAPSVRSPGQETAPEVVPQGRNKAMVVGAILFLLLAVVIFVTQLR